MKEVPSEVILESVQKLIAGDIAVSPALSQRLMQRAVDGRIPHPDPTSSLSDRELEVLFRIGKGQSSSEIAGSLHLSVKTVETHRANLRRKLSLHSGAELLRYAVAWRHKEGQCLDARSAFEEE
jgi:DNA-binding NarL/FixJ family response regulator